MLGLKTNNRTTLVITKNFFCCYFMIFEEKLETHVDFDINFVSKKIFIIFVKQKNLRKNTHTHTHTHIIDSTIM
jgi:hypothetical protein